MACGTWYSSAPEVDLLVRHLQRAGLNDISLSVPAGQTLCIHGPSGSGKSLLLRAIADLDPNQGQVSLGGIRRESVPAPQWRGLVSYLPPESHWWQEQVRAHASDWNLATLEGLGFAADVLDWPVSRLSTGERQRLSIARSLARTPRAMLLDEPTANLDPGNTLVVEQVLSNYQQETRAPMLWVSHDPAQRERVALLAREIIDGILQ